MATSQLYPSCIYLAILILLLPRLLTCHFLYTQHLSLRPAMVSSKDMIKGIILATIIGPPIVAAIIVIVQSAPLPILESHELCGMTLEYRRECGRDSVLQSLTTVSGGGVGSLVDPGYVDCQHLLRLEGGAEIVKGRTEWRPKYANCVGTLGSLPAESS